MILIAVATITGERILRSTDKDAFASMTIALPSAQMAKCNVSSIASATGLNRETTRRKVRDLLAKGLLSKLADGTISFTLGLIQEQRTQDLVFTQLDVLVKSMNDLIRDGVVSAGQRAN